MTTSTSAGDHAEEIAMKRKPHDSVTVEMTAPPEHVYTLVSDITRMGEWSPECIKCAWTKGATGPEVGARFKARNKGGRGPAWFNTPVVTASYDAERPPGGFMNWLTMKWTGSQDRDEDLHVGMTTTLARVKAAAEAA